MAAGVVKARGWLVPMAVRLGAVGLLGLAVFNPDLYIAEQNLTCRPAPLAAAAELDDTAESIRRALAAARHP